MANYKVFSFDKIPSTQTYANDMIAAGNAADHIAIVATSQTAGHGRYRRKWVSKPGNLYVSFIYRINERDARISYAVAVAVAETVAEFGATPNVKWPNDVLVKGKKISGILIEYVGDFVIVGIGVNITSAPQLENYQAARMCDYGDVDRIKFLNRLMRNMDKWLAADFADVRARWTELAVGINGRVQYQGMPVEFIGINGDGAMVLRRGGQDLLAYGDEIIMDAYVNSHD